MRAQQTEGWLGSELGKEGLRWEYRPTVLWSSFDRKRSLQNHARLKAIVPEAVEQYGLMLIDGMVPPAVVAYESKHGLVLIDGVQRMEAAFHLERPDTDAYVVTTDNVEVVEGLTLTANIHLNGYAPPVDERLIQARLFRNRHGGLTIKEVARRFCLKPDHLERALRIEAVLGRAGVLGLSVDNIVPTTLESLNSLESDPVFREVVMLIQRAGLRGGLVQELIAAARQGRSEQEQLDAVEAFAQRPDVADMVLRQQRGRPAKHKTQRNRLFTYLEQLTKHLDRHQTLEALELYTDEDRRRMVEYINGVVTRTQQLLAVPVGAAA